ncbi:MAG: DEAD/DEAH box helicase [Nanoarchaeota archaeon]|nr:DEAD/DEAH box helicase [Nanoarchaeota archaeon]
MESFKKLGIAEPILRTIEEQKFEVPSEIQEKTIPLVIEGKDVIAGSATGSGKTLAFGAGIIQNSKQGKGIQALILTPTRELAQQINDALRLFSKYTPLQIVEVYGGVSINPQIHRLRNADVVVGTPGRLLDHLQRRTLDLSHVKTLVLDEADRMLDMGFIDDVKKIMQKCPEKRQTLLFSATIPEGIRRLTESYMDHPIKISAESYVDPKKLKQVYYDIQKNIKFSLLVHLLNNERAGLVMIFCNSRATVDFVAKNLKANKIDAHAIHGGYSQDRRSRALSQFHSKKAWVLVCTDVAARGLDIPGVSHIYNYDLPKESKQYIHRIGRTARAGEKGRAVNLLCEQDHDNFSRILREYDVEIEKLERPHVERLATKSFDSPRSHGFQGRPRRHNQGSPRRNFGRDKRY